mmetsp:Transcript_28068/g.71771  ORF Transcript_28068/g.71771 Transcript_28068/m.71771 type:complete len:289 (+) Transcript_28068:248-1114(+)
MLKEAIGDRSSLPGSPTESVARRSSVRVIVISFLCGILVPALKRSLSLPLAPLAPSSSSAESPSSPWPCILIDVAYGYESVMANSRSRKDVESLAAYSVAPKAAASSPLSAPSSCLRPKKSIAACFTCGMRVAPPTTSTRWISSLVRLACASAVSSGATSRFHSPRFSASAVNSSREMTIRRSRSLCSASTPTWYLVFAERMSFTLSAALRSFPTPLGASRTSSLPLSCFSLNSSARKFITMSSKSLPPSVVSQPRPLTAIAPCVLFFLPSVAVNWTTETLYELAPRS